MKKILFSISFMVLLLQFSASVQASQGKYVIQDTPVTFFEKSVQTIEHKEFVKEENDSQEAEQEVSEKPVVKQEEIVPEEVKSPEQEQEQELSVDEKNQSSTVKEENKDVSEEGAILEQEEKNVESVQKQNSSNADNKSSQTINDNYSTFFAETLDKAEMIIDNADLIAAKGMLLMLKAVSQNEEEYKGAEEAISSAEKVQNENGIYESLFGVKDNMLLLIDENLKTVDFSTITQEQKYLWGQGSYVLQVAQNRYKNLSNDLSSIYKPIVDGKVSPKSVKKQLAKAEKITEKIKDNIFLQEVVLSIATRINAENQINIVIPEKEQVRTNPNGITYIIENRVEEVDTLLKATMSDFAQKVGNKEILVNAQKSKEDKYFDSVAQGLDDIANNIKDNNLVLTREQIFYLSKVSEVLTSITDEYAEITNSAQNTVKAINKNKMIKNVAVIDVEKLQDIQNKIENKSNSVKLILTKINDINTAKN